MSASTPGGDPQIDIPLGPLEQAPRVDVPAMESMDAARAALRHALRGLPLGAYDRRIIAWLETGPTDQPTLITLASLIERARTAGGEVR